MPKWFKRSKAPKQHPENPGEGISLTVSTTNGVESRNEEIDLIELLEQVLTGHGLSVERYKSWLVEKETGMSMVPQIASFQPLDDMGATSCTTIECRHTEMFPEGVFEYQHSSGDTFHESIRSGLDQWAQLDLVPLLDSFKSSPEACATMVMDFPEEDGRPARSRRVVLGPVMHMVAEPEEQGEDEEHPQGCSCCLLMNTINAFDALLHSDNYFAIRMFAMRGDDGKIAADCRVNGLDFDIGEDALVEYATSWPGSGLNYRKQYVIIQPSTEES